MSEKAVSSSVIDALRRFYLSDIYPLVVCLSVIITSVSGLEVYFTVINVAFATGALVLCDTVRPFLISLFTSYMQVSVKNSPFYPNRSDYYFTGWRFPFLIVTVITVFAAILFFVIKNKIYKKISLKSTPMLIPLLVLSFAFLLNGTFSRHWEIKSVVFALGHVAVYLLLFLFLYHGFSEKDTPCELARYFAYVSMLVSVVISAELVHLFITSDVIFINGSINKGAVALGWGIWNLVGVSLAVLIPMTFYGMHKNKYPWLYFAAATVAYLMSILTMSRNALVFSTLTYGACVIISCFVGKNKRVFRVIVGVLALLVLIVAVVFWSKIEMILSDFFERGFSDNGRFEIWSAAFDKFTEYPVFGGGFYSLYVESFEGFGPLPLMAHNIILELLCAMGIVGLLAYAFYLWKLFTPVFKKPNFMKTMLAFSMAVLIFESLLDNFVFNIYPVFYYTAAAAIIFKSTNAEKAQKSDKLEKNEEKNKNLSKRP